MACARVVQGTRPMSEKAVSSNLTVPTNDDVWKNKVLYGGGSSVGRAFHCDWKCRGFKSLPSPHICSIFLLSVNTMASVPAFDSGYESSILSRTTKIYHDSIRNVVSF